jgi:hypothetical protein
VKLGKVIRATVTAVVAVSTAVAVPTAARATPGDGWVGWWNINSSYYWGVYMMLYAPQNAPGTPVQQNQRWLLPNSSQQEPAEDWLMTDEGGGWWSLRNAATPGWLAMAVSGGRTDQGAPIIVWNYEKGHTEQQWKMVQLSGDPAETYHFKNRKSGLCLAVPGGQLSNYVNLVQWPCEVGHTEQEWASYDG